MFYVQQYSLRQDLFFAPKILTLQAWHYETGVLSVSETHLLVQAITSTCLIRINLFTVAM